MIIERGKKTRTSRKRKNMRLTENNIAYINEIHLKGGKIHVFVMMKNYAMGDSRFYECDYDLVNLPKAVLKFMFSHQKALVETDKELQRTEYQYK